MPKLDTSEAKNAVYQARIFCGDHAYRYANQESEASSVIILYINQKKMFIVKYNFL